MKRIQETISLYTPYDDFEAMYRCIDDVLKPHIRNKDHYRSYIRLSLQFECQVYIHFITKSKCYTVFQQQIQRLYQIIMNRDCKNIYIKQNILYQIALFQSGYAITFEMDDKARDEFMLLIMEVADKMDALVFWESGEISNSYGDILLDSRGNSEVKTFFPIDGYLKSDIIQKLPLKMKNHVYESNLVLEEKGIYAPTRLLPIHDDKLYIFQEPLDILKRLVASVCLAVYSDYLIQENFQGDVAYHKVEHLLQMFQAYPYFTTDEIEYLNHFHPKKEKVFYYVKYYECAYVFLWALNFIKELNLLPQERLNNFVVERLFQNKSFSQLCKKAKLREKEELTKEMDLAQRYLWSTQDAKRLNFQPFKGMNETQMYLRMHAFSWMMNETYHTWDQVKVVLQSIS